jgi:hypothetical protein
VIVLSLLLVLGSAASLVVGLATDNQVLIWASIGASVCAALVLAAAVMRRRQLDLAEPATVSATSSGSSTTGGTAAGLAHGRHHSGEAAVPVDPSVPSGISAPPPTEVPPPDEPVSYPDPPDEPPEEDVSATDALRVIDLRDEVLVVDGRPRYHLAGCRHLTGRETVGLPISEARESGFTPCAWCRPDSRLAETARGTGAP